MSYEKAELAARLMDLKFDEDDAIYAANECSSLYMAISYLQQDCELCASKYGVKEVLMFSGDGRDKKLMDYLGRWFRCFTVRTDAVATVQELTS